MTYLIILLRKWYTEQHGTYRLGSVCVLVDRRMEAYILSRFRYGVYGSHGTYGPEH